MTRSSLVAILVACFVLTICLRTTNLLAEQIQLSAILPKLQAIHEDAQTLLIKNAELKSKILVGLQAQNEAKLRLVKGEKFGQIPLPPTASPTTPSTLTSHQQNVDQQQSQAPPTLPPPPPPAVSHIKEKNDKNSTIDYLELEEFNKWVEVNLDYAVKNTQASIEAFKDEAQQSSGLVDYSEQAIKDGIEGVKYWQSAVIFQDKTLKNEKTETEK